MDPLSIFLLAALFIACAFWFHEANGRAREQAARSEAESRADAADALVRRMVARGADSRIVRRPGPPAPNADPELVRVLIDGDYHSFTFEQKARARERDVSLFS